MLCAGDGLYIQLPGHEDDRILYPGQVMTANGASCTAAIEEQGLALEVGLDVGIYYRRQHEFVRQQARIGAIMRTQPSAVVVLETIGEPVAADSRACYRVSAAATDLRASVDQENDCRVLDISESGFAVLTDARHRVGVVLPVMLRYDGVSFAGDALVEAARESASAGFRCGMRAVGPEGGRGELSKGLAHIATSIQRRQLRRRAGG